MFQLSLRTLLVAMAVVALAIVSLRFATPGWLMVVVTVAFVALGAALIAAFVDRGPRQAFAIGFAVASLLYALVLIVPPIGEGRGWTQHTEFNPGLGTLPTTRLLAPLYWRVAEVRSVDLSSGDRIDRRLDFQSGGTGVQQYTMGETPSRRVFMLTGHIWWAMLLGLCGGWFAQWIYVRRQRPAS